MQSGFVKPVPQALAHAVDSQAAGSAEQYVYENLTLDSKLAGFSGVDRPGLVQNFYWRGLRLAFLPGFRCRRGHIGKPCGSYCASWMVSMTGSGYAVPKAGACHCARRPVSTT